MRLSEIKEIGSRGILFTFEFGDSVYLINAMDKLILCDTHEGKKSMEHVKQYIQTNDLMDKQLYIFNSHSDWDHIWGNDAFDAPIIAHQSCSKRMKERAILDLEIYSNFHDDTIKIKYPTITFKKQLVFEDIGIEFIYAPGHTIDSTICFDKDEKNVYVGDLLEKPIPILSYLHLDKYIDSLELIKRLKPNIIITTHSNIVSETLIDEHILYLKDVMSGRYLTNTTKQAPIRHGINMKNLLLLQYEEKMRNELQEHFNYYEHKIDLWHYISQRHHYYQKRIWDISELSYQDLKEDLRDYFDNIIK